MLRVGYHAIQRDEMYRKQPFGLFVNVKKRTAYLAVKRSRTNIFPRIKYSILNIPVHLICGNEYSFYF